ncbi:MAG TPA: DNA-protecting protein DprA [Clostridiales bacterium]|nr:DNA-protecting protein DprA [Clostridiales bacterium]
MQDRDYIVALSLVPGVGARRLGFLLERFGTPRAAWEAAPEELAACPGLPPAVACELVSRRRRLDPAGLVRRYERTGVKVVTYLDEEYPAGLRLVADRPPVLFVRGDPQAAARGPAVAVVGTRRPTPYGLEVTADIAVGLAEAGVVVISGLALGIDTAAHRAVLDAGGTTVAVLAGGVMESHPRENRSLAEAIGRSAAVISPFPPGTIAVRGNFLRRNRVVAGLALGVVVTEAPVGSGALTTAAFARALGRKVMAVPGTVTSPASAGCLELLRGAGRLVRDADDVLAELGLARTGGRTSGKAGQDRGRGRDAGEARGAVPGEGAGAATVLSALGRGEVVPFALLMARTGLEASRLGTILGVLEVKGLVSRLPGGNYVRK